MKLRNVIILMIFVAGLSVFMYNYMSDAKPNNPKLEAAIIEGLTETGATWLLASRTGWTWEQAETVIGNLKDPTASGETVVAVGVLAVLAIEGKSYCEGGLGSHACAAFLKRVYQTARRMSKGENIEFWSNLDLVQFYGENCVARAFTVPAGIDLQDLTQLVAWEELNNKLYAEFRCDELSVKAPNAVKQVFAYLVAFLWVGGLLVVLNLFASAASKLSV